MCSHSRRVLSGEMQSLELKGDVEAQAGALDVLTGVWFPGKQTLRWA